MIRWFALAILMLCAAAQYAAETNQLYIVKWNGRHGWESTSNVVNIATNPCPVHVRTKADVCRVLTFIDGRKPFHLTYPANIRKQ